mmetsp:Transcript_4156/g.7391  ORF Transcript_4156/g.7391 Transcript_4156/m.7391 type:complete len:224 (+) Transcript_4156:1087-1758(+)
MLLGPPAAQRRHRNHTGANLPPRQGKAFGGEHAPQIRRQCRRPAHHAGRRPRPPGKTVPPPSSQFPNHEIPQGQQTHSVPSPRESKRGRDDRIHHGGIETGRQRPPPRGRQRPRIGIITHPRSTLGTPTPRRRLQPLLGRSHDPQHPRIRTIATRVDGRTVGRAVRFAAGTSVRFEERQNLLVLGGVGGGDGERESDVRVGERGESGPWAGEGFVDSVGGESG